MALIGLFDDAPILHLVQLLSAFIVHFLGHSARLLLVAMFVIEVTICFQPLLAAGLLLSLLAELLAHLGLRLINLRNLLLESNLVLSLPFFLRVSYRIIFQNLITAFVELLFSLVPLEYAGHLIQLHFILQLEVSLDWVE